MTPWSRARKRSIEARKVPAFDPKEDMDIRVGQRICQIVYSSCDCKQRGLKQVCDVMRNAAQHAMREILGK